MFFKTSRVEETLEWARQLLLCFPIQLRIFETSVSIEPNIFGDILRTSFLEVNNLIKCFFLNGFFLDTKILQCNESQISGI